MTEATNGAREPGTDVELSQKVIAQFLEMVEIVPDAVDAGGGERIIEKIFEATTPEELEAPWTEDRSFPLGVPLKVTWVTKRQSDYGQGLPHYMVCECIDLETGEQVTYNTGSVSATAQILIAVVRDMLPITVRLVSVDSKRNPGRKAQHLEILSDDEAKPKKARRG